MSRLRFLGRTAVAAGLAIVSAAGGGVARGDPPAPGDECTVPHSIAQDGNGRTMWCNPTTTGPHTLVWQYGGPS